MKKISLARLSLIAAMLLSGPIVSMQAAVSLETDFIREFHHGNHLQAGDPQNVPPAQNPSGNSTGSGVTYWPAQDTYLLLDNGPSRRVVEFTLDHVYVRTITLSGFLDPEDIQWISGNSFVIAQEYNESSGSINELVVINLPTGTTSTSVNISSATRRLTFPTSSFGNSHNKGIEAVAIIGNTFYFTTEYAPPSPANSWKVWTVPNSGNGQVPPTAAFDLATPDLLTGRATDISGLATDGLHLWLLSDESKAVLKVTTSGTLIQHYSLPEPSGFAWNQPEGIGFFFDRVDKRLTLLLTGEIGNPAGAGVDFMLLKTPGVKLATVNAIADGWIFYPFLNGGGSQQYYSTVYTIDTDNLVNPAPQAVYKRLQPEYSTLYVANLNPSTLYKVRVHLSSIYFSGYGNVSQTVWCSNGGSPNFQSGVNPYASGVFNKAMIVDLGNMYPSSSGEFWLGIDPSAPGKTVVVSGIEIVPN